MYCRYPVFTVLLIVLLMDAAAQQGQKNTMDRPVFTLRTNPLSVFETDANVMLGAGIQWSPRWAATVEPAYIFSRLYESNQSITNVPDGASGFKLRTDIRYYLKDYEFARRAIVFIAPEFHYKYVVTGKWDDFGINCNNGQCDFYERARYREIKNEIGGLIKMGVSVRGFGNRVGFEFFGGLGAKLKKITERGLPLGGSFVNPPTGSAINFVPRDGWLLMLPGGIKICYLIR